uniref:PH domain-containing protein n=1 Tax=Rhabditophanes sp. KR3021 TaxID=114890 RepID=A0AC35TZ35_9BILA
MGACNLLDQKDILRQGWLHKWTNYMKGYQKRWFVVDSQSFFSYYRTQSDVTNSCRGSINLKEARIVSVPHTNNLTISASTQVFHIKTANEIDRLNWLNTLELARHKGICMEEDEEEEMAVEIECDFKPAVDKFIKSVNKNVEEYKNNQIKLERNIDALIRTFDCVVSLSDNEKQKIKHKKEKLNNSITNMLEMSKKLTTDIDNDAKKLVKVISHGQEQRIQLQGQLEALARQHSKLERVALLEKEPISKKSSVDSAYSASQKEPTSEYAMPAGTEASTLSYSDSDSDSDDLFVDASEYLDKGGSKTSRRQILEETGLFDAKIVTIPSDNESYATPRSDKMGTSEAKTTRTRRTKVPNKLNKPLNLWSFMKNCIGKELSKIPMPVNFNEPISYLQRITEDLEYANLFDEASHLDNYEQLAYIAAYAASCYSATNQRTTKPFNPLLGETFECDRMDELGWRSITEQVTHHPPAAAHHADGRTWEMHQDFQLSSKFRGKYMSVVPVGATHIKFKESGNLYTFRKITTTVHNIIIGKLWIDNHGDMIIKNHTTGDICYLKFHATGYFAREPPKKVTGFVKDKNGFVHWHISGFWDKYIDIARVTKQPKEKDTNGTNVPSTMVTDTPKRIWTVNDPLPGCENMYNFTKLTVTLNEEEEGVAPTDSRLRPDQRLMENGYWDEANLVKNELEEKQRTARKNRELEEENLSKQGLEPEEYKPLWFKKVQDEKTASDVHIFLHEYWDCKNKQAWDRCPKLFNLP